MTLEEAIKEAIESLDFEANESYEGSELDDPEIKAWQEKKFEAIRILQTIK